MLWSKQERDDAERLIRARLVQYTDFDVIVGEHSAPKLGRRRLSDAEAETAVALNIVLEAIGRQSRSAQSEPFGIFEFHQLVFEELFSRELPRLAPTRIPGESPEELED